jgi:hypothetical protein
MTREQEKLVEKYKKKVHKQYPGAKLFAMPKGYYTIAVENDDFTVTDVLSEYCFLPTKDPVKAWELAQVSSKTTQNLNRTHPLRVEGQKLADKLQRIAMRRQRGE